ncbi:rhodanese-like domain-containing protein [Photobacterium kishitanii]|uniref:rhodanese-like domain-containing protein n=1 Tax=Photobacterium kishitanii TaxID=318456 RepID=UPI000D172F14|nr:rhodanese-like domain-containing protein [Photobacterium kishitanii]PSV24540.1 rhodanese-like domain-containing protein [Photobacterium kishitanii]
MKPALKYGLLITTLSLSIITSISYAKNVSVQQFWQLQQQQPNVIIDVRTSAEFAAGHLNSAINIPYQQIATIVTRYQDKTQPILLYCKSGRRAEIAATTLEKLGYTAIYNGLNYQKLKTSQPISIP